MLLGVFLVYPTIYTFFLSFNRGRRGEFTNWVGFDNYINLFTNDPNFINLGTFPPSGAFFNNVLWLIFYTSIVIFLGLVIAVMASRVRYEAHHQVDRLPADGHRGDRPRGHLGLRLCAEREDRAAERHPRMSSTSGRSRGSATRAS